MNQSKDKTICCLRLELDSERRITDKLLRTIAAEAKLDPKMAAVYDGLTKWIDRERCIKPSFIM